MIYEFKVTLKDVGLPVWRKVLINGNATFHDLHRLLQASFDWFDYHLHTFNVRNINGKQVNEVEISQEKESEIDFDDFFNMTETYDEKEEILADWFLLAKDRMIYTYDFGDNWDHEIVFVKKVKPKKGVTYPRCIDAKHLAPEEDSRGEVIMGQVDLEFKDSESLVEEINEEIHFRLDDFISEVPIEDQMEGDSWRDVLLLAKEFHKLKPWNTMYDNHIVAVTDPVTEENLFCSVLGGGGEIYGLAVYIGRDGYRTLNDILIREESDFWTLQGQRSLLLSFEDREELEKEDYARIKTYDIPFRGRKTWPSFRSYVPGYYPWFMSDEEARIMHVALEQTIKVCTEIDAGLEVPDMLFDEKVFAKVPRNVHGEVVFENEIIDLENYLENEPIVDLAIPELNLKRIKKIKKALPITVEFSMVHVNMPVQEMDGERPIFPLLILGADHEEGIVHYQNMIHKASDLGDLQQELLEMIQTLDGIPETLLMHPKTAHILAPVIDKLDLHVKVKSYLPIIHTVVDGLHEDILSN